MTNIIINKNNLFIYKILYIVLTVLYITFFYFNKDNTNILLNINLSYIKFFIIILLIIMWTLEKGYQLYEIGQSGKGNGIIPILWWLIFMPYFWRALKVENERRKSQKAGAEAYAQENQKIEGVNDHKEFCSNCGKEVSQLNNFCKYCGNKIIQ